MALCEGCQEFKYRMFQPDDKFPKGRVRITLHKNFAELSACAESHCNLCKFVSREITLKVLEDVSCDDVLKDTQHEMGLDVYLKLHKFGRNGSKLLEWGYGSYDEGISWTYHHEAEPHKYREAITGLEQLVDMSRRWLVTCQNEHAACRKYAMQRQGFFPTRLLDVGSSGQSTVKLILGETLSSIGSTTYLTLSYCWGTGNGAACTNNSNLDERLRGFSISSLPQTIQDAITLTRAFGVGYLWVDALCIVQGDPDSIDWQREVPNMGKIYRHALCTIAASSAADSSHGFLRRSTALQWPVQDHLLVRGGDLTAKGDYVTLQVRTPNWFARVERSVLSRRGWVLQERMLSTRTLHWTKGGLFWECNEFQGSEYSEKVNLSHHHEGTPWYFQLSLLAENIGEKAAVARESRIEDARLVHRGLWVKLLQEFSGMQLTHLTDKLPALAGLGEELAWITKSDYEMGVFKQNLVQELAWVIRPETLRGDVIKQQKERIENVPSWCWASSRQCLEFRPGLYSGAVARELATHVRLNGQRIYARSFIGRLQVEALEEGTISLTASPYLSIRASPHTFRPRRSCSSETVYNRAEAYDDFAVFDTLLEAPPKQGGTITCVQWLNWEKEYHDFGLEVIRNINMTGALIVAPTGEGSNIYRRIGWLEVFDTDSFEKESQDIILV